MWTESGTRDIHEEAQASLAECFHSSSLERTMPDPIEASRICILTLFKRPGQPGKCTLILLKRSGELGYMNHSSI